MSKSAPDSGKGVIKLKLGACLTAPSKRLLADLDEVARQCNVARNAMVRCWERWHEDHPDHQPPPVLDKETGEPKVNKKGEPLREDRYFPYALVSSTSSTGLYRKGQEVCPTLAAKIISALQQEVVKRLKSDLPYDHEGACKGLRRCDAVLANEVSRDCYRQLSIPVPSQDSALCYVGASSRRLSPGVLKDLLEMGKSSALVRFPLFSQQSGRDNLAMICRIEVRQLPTGLRALLRKVSTGQWKMCDSKLAKIDGKWFLLLTYDQPQAPLGLNKETSAQLALLPADSPYPMEICVGQWMAGEAATSRGPRWRLGDAKVLEAQFARLEARRMAMRSDYRADGPGSRGHGRQRFFRDIKPVTRQVRHLMERYSKHLVAEVVKFCQRFDCGQIVYREPSLPVREKTWYAKRNIPYDWSGLLPQLKHKCWVHDIDLTIERMKMKEFKALETMEVG